MAELRGQLDAQSAELDERLGELDERDRAVDERESAVAARDAQLTARDEELAERARQVEEAEAAAETVRQGVEGQQQAWAAEQAQREREREALAAELAEARQRLESTQTQADDAIENESLQHKFELAVQDVRRLRGRVAELEEELARRPDGDQTDSADLVHLRAERDALAERVEELEREPSARSEATTEQEAADLQRRFELAVEDVRELKTKNTQLEAQLAEAGRQPAVVRADGNAMDWESQKRRLLESLECEGESDEPARRKEQVTIEGTIRITDEVVATKDDEIASLREQLASLRAAGGGRWAWNASGSWPSPA